MKTCRKKILSIICILNALLIFALPQTSSASPACLLDIPLDDNSAKVVTSIPWLLQWPDYSAAKNPAYISNYVAVGNSTIAPGPYLGWCVDFQDNIASAPTTYDALMFSSCDPNLDAYLQALNLGYPLSVYVGPEGWHKINYLLNHRNGAYFWNVQIAIWNLVGGPVDPLYLRGPSVGAPPSNLAQINQLIADANANAANWEAKCGDKIAVVVAVPSWTHTVQLTIIEVPIPCTPCIEVTKTVACLTETNTVADFGKFAAGFQGKDLPGFAYSITVTNCGSATLSNLTVIDNMFGDITTNLFAPDSILAPGGTATYYYAAAVGVNTTNTVVATGQSVVDGTLVQDDDYAIVHIDSASLTSKLTLTSTCDQDGNANDNHVLVSGCEEGCYVNYELEVCNNGAAPLTGVTLSSTSWSALGLPLPAPFDLEPGECKTVQSSVNVNCPGGTVRIDVSAQVRGDLAHCGVYDFTGTNLLCVTSSTSGTVECGPSVGSICGKVILDCAGDGDLAGDEGLKVLVTLKNFEGAIVATNYTDADGKYCFENLPSGTYKVVVTPPPGYTQTAGSTKPQWKDKYGRHCWKDHEDNTRWKENGVECWYDRYGTKFWKDKYGRDCWQDKWGRICYKTPDYKNCNEPKNNEEIVTLEDCENETNVNFSYKGSVGNICGFVFLDCDGDGDLTGGDAGLQTKVTLKDSWNSIVATTTTDATGAYCFENLKPGNYKVVVTPPAGYSQSAGSTKPQWKDKYGRHCWQDNDGNTHWKENGVECWIGKDGYKHWKDNYGRDCWEDKWGRKYSKSCDYQGSNDPKNDEECVSLKPCEDEKNVNFSYKGVDLKAVVSITGPKDARCGQTVTYTVTVSNNGTGCFTKGCKVTIFGKTYSIPSLAAGTSYSFEVKTSFSYYDRGYYECKAVVDCYPSFGSHYRTYGSCKTYVR